MSETTPEPLMPVDSLMDALLVFARDIFDEVNDLCSYGIIIGETYVPFNPDPEDDCEDDEGPQCTQGWVRVANIAQFGATDGFGGDQGGVPRYTLEIGILRCFPIADDGEAPTATEHLVAATQAMADSNAIYCAALASDAWDYITMAQWTPMGPQGGQYGGTWLLSVEME